MDWVRLPRAARCRILGYLDFSTAAKVRGVSKGWGKEVAAAVVARTSSVWIYVVFRRNIVYGHTKLLVKVTRTGPIFWGQDMYYVTCCNCHLAINHLVPIIGILKLLAPKGNRIEVERVCLVDTPVSIPFVPDSLVSFCVLHLPSLEFLYFRELDLQYVNFATIQRLASLPRLKRIVVHNCAGYEVFEDFGLLKRQLMVVKGRCSVNSLSINLHQDEVDLASRFEVFEDFGLLKRQLMVVKGRCSVNSLSINLHQDEVDLASRFELENKKAIFLTSRKSSIMAASKSADFEAL